MAFRAASPLQLLTALALAALVVGCTTDTSRVDALETAITAQGRQLEVLARTATPTAKPSPTATPTPSPSPTAAPKPTSTPQPTPAATSTPSLSTMLRQVLPSVLRVTTNDAVGTGFVVWQLERVVTAYHVVKSDPSHVVLLTMDGVQQKATVLAVDDKRDLALLEAKGLKATPLPIMTETALAEPVVVVGYQNGLPGEASVTRGIVSATRLNSKGVSVLQTDAAINHGASGGPVLTELGQVLGLVSYGLTLDGNQLEGLGFAISSGELESFRADAEAGRLKPPSVSTATPTRAPR